MTLRHQIDFYGTVLVYIQDHLVAQYRPYQVDLFVLKDS